MIDLHTTPTANGYRASIMLEEVALPYRVFSYDLQAGDHQRPAYLAMNPVGRMPTIVDDDVDGGSVSIYGTVAILLHLAEKTGRFLPSQRSTRAKVFEWLGFISSDLGPAYTGQFVFNVVMKEKSSAAIEFYNNLCLRFLQPLETQLGKTEYLAGGEITIADMLAYPAMTMSTKRFPGNLEAYPHIARWVALVGARPAVQRGMKVPS